jgi:2-polyprenyl-6-methoxyphenol hydroxylase-like FAD-dependent oxidoreductase
MKVVIIGSGIAGLALAILLKQKGYIVSIYERGEQVPSIGHAFLVHPDAKKV